MLTLQNHKIFGHRGILIKLYEYEEEFSTNEAGIITPLYEAYETDGGRPDAKLRTDKFSAVGKIVQISKAAQDLLNQEEMDLKIGDVISIHKAYLSGANEFLVNKDTPNQKFEGYLLIHPNMIQSQIINYDKYN